MKKNLLFLFVIAMPLFLKASTSTDTQTAPQKPVNTAPASFPVCTQAFKNIYSGDLSVKDAQSQSWYVSYDLLYKEFNGTQTSNPNVLSILSQLKQESITPEAATSSFTALQQTLINNVNSLLVNQ